MKNKIEVINSLIQCLIRLEKPSGEINRRIRTFLTGDYPVIAKDYTGNLSIALTLLPENAEWTRHKSVNGRMTISVNTPDRLASHGQGANPAIEMCVACLRFMKEGLGGRK